MRLNTDLPRWIVVCLGLVVLLVLIPAVDFAVPWALSMLSARHGWHDGRPGAANLLGLAPILIGEAGVLWFVVTVIRHLPRLPSHIDIRRPQFLMTSGPFAYTRNPRYLSAGILWFGQAVFYGSVAAFVGFALLLTMILLVVPREERTLESRFGESYRHYKANVPRWLF